jgi:hypothetical protein
MNTYQKLIAEATGITDIEKIDAIEDYMRHIYFHSTLSWQDKETLVIAAKESAQELNYVL